MSDDYDFSKDIPPTESQRLRWKSGDSNIHDPDAATGSAWQNRPAYQFQTEAHREAKGLPIVPKGSRKDWGVKAQTTNIKPRKW